MISQIHFPRRRLFRKVFRGNILWLYCNANWKCFLRNPEMRNYENNHFWKVALSEDAKPDMNIFSNATSPMVRNDENDISKKSFKKRIK